MKLASAHRRIEPVRLDLPVVAGDLRAVGEHRAQADPPRGVQRGDIGVPVAGQPVGQVMRGQPGAQRSALRLRAGGR